MRPYKRLTWICGIISFLSLVICLFLHYVATSEETAFWINVCLAVFGSALLSALTSLITYFHEKRSTLESFMYQCKNLLHALNKYQDSMSLEEKMKFYLDYYDIDKSAWDANYGNMDFFTEKITGNRKYIYEKIYLPILRFNQAVNNHVWHFRWYFDGSGKNTPVMEMFVEQLEQHLLYRDEKSIPTNYDKTGKPIAFCEVTNLESKLVREISQELDGEYYRIMYGKRFEK
jgi:hypothetical protein